MFHKIVGPMACCLLLSWGILAAPRKEGRSPGYYYPSTVGDKLAYEEKDGDQSREVVLEVTDARPNGAAMIVTVRTREGGGTSGPWRYELSAKGVYKVGEGDAVLETPECFLRLPFKKGETWKTAHAHDGITVTTKYTVVGEEEVEVPAGKFRCIRIESEFEFKGMTYTRTRWTAPRCGMVKELLVGKDNANADYERTTVLKSVSASGK